MDGCRHGAALALALADSKPAKFPISFFDLQESDRDDCYSAGARHSSLTRQQH
jgi:hypothetical protein